MNTASTFFVSKKYYSQTKREKKKIKTFLGLFDKIKFGPQKFFFGSCK